MKSGWEKKRLGELFVFKNGRAFKKQEWTTRGMPIIRIQNLNNEQASFNYFDGKYEQDIRVESGDLLFSWSGTVGSSFGSHLWHGRPGVLNQHIFKIRLNEGITKRYAYHGLRHITDQIEKSVNGAVGLVHITKEKLNEFTLPVPPLAEQKRIVAKLDEAFAGLAKAKENAEKNLQNTQALFDSHLNEVFAKRGEGWEMKRLGDVLVKTETVDPTRTPKSEFDYIDVSSVSNQTLTIQETQRLKGMEAPSRARRLVRTNDVLFATIRPTLRRIAIVPEKLDKQVCSTGYFVLRANSVTNHRIIFYLLQTEMFMASMERLQRGASYPAVTDSDIRSQIAFIPPLNEQKRLVTELDALSTETQRLESIYEQKLDALESLKKSILHEAFSGNL